MLRRLEPPPGIQTGLPAIPPMLGLIYGLDRSSDTELAAQELRKAFYAESRGKISILDAVIPSMAAYNQAAGRQTPVHRFEVKRYNKQYKNPAASAHDTMLGLIHELLPHLSDTTPEWSVNNNSSTQDSDQEDRRHD